MKKTVFITLAFLVSASVCFAKPAPGDIEEPTVNPAVIQAYTEEPAAIKQYIAEHPEVKNEIEAQITPKMKKEDIKKVIEKTILGKMSGTKSSQGLGLNFFSEYWMQIWALVLSLVGIILAITGFSFANAKKKKSTSKYLVRIDDTFTNFKTQSSQCEAELYRIQEQIEEDLKTAKIDESTYHLLTSRIEKYKKQIQSNQ